MMVLRNNERVESKFKLVRLVIHVSQCVQVVHYLHKILAFSFKVANTGTATTQTKIDTITMVQYMIQEEMLN